MLLGDLNHSWIKLKEISELRQRKEQLSKEGKLK